MIMPFDHQVREVLHDVPVFDRAGFALIGVADDVFGGPGALRTISHFIPVGNPAPPMPRKPLAFSAAMISCRSRFSMKRRTTMIAAEPVVRIAGRWSALSLT